MSDTLSRAPVNYILGASSQYMYVTCITVQISIDKTHRR